MKIYTKTGDTGETSLSGGVRVAKDDLRIRTYGTLDELNAVIGLVKAESNLPAACRDRFTRIQYELFQLGAELATPRGMKVSSALIESSHVLVLESEIDEMELSLKPLKNFILPGGSRAAALVHFARTVSRRAERELITLSRAEPARGVVLEYINRMSDYFFVFARFLNHLEQVEDILWKAPKN